jgi:Barstar (barnase inhibitor)
MASNSLGKGLHLLIGTEAEADLYAYRRGRDAGVTVRILRGNRCGTLERCMDEFAAALQLPYCFEGTLVSLDQQLEEMHWPTERVILLLTNLEATLRRPAGTLAELLRILERYVDSNSGGQTPASAPVRASARDSARAVELVLHCEPRHAQAVRGRLLAAGISVSDITGS